MKFFRRIQALKEILKLRISSKTSGFRVARRCSSRVSPSVRLRGINSYKDLRNFDISYLVVSKSKKTNISGSY